MASVYHCCSTDTNPRHHLCPDSNTSWCFYKRSLAADEAPPSHGDRKGHFELEPDQLEQVQAAVEELITDETLCTCLRAKTQNPNDSLYSQVWSYYPKDVLTSKTKLDFAAAHEVCNFNVGYVESNLHSAPRHSFLRNC